MNGTPRILIVICTLFAMVSCGGTPPVPNKVVKTSQVLDSVVKLPDCNVNVYIENSGSMDGYVAGVTEFEQSVYSYLSDIKLLDFCQSLNLNYINSEILKQPDDVSDFIEKLEPAVFRLRGGDRKTTDISNLFESIMNEQGENDISILISDFVFSPGDKDASQYLTNQSTGIKIQFVKRLKTNTNYAAVLYRLESKFSGKYYNKFDNPTIIDGERPFFIWLLGNKDQLQRLITTVDKNDIKGNGVDHTYCISKMCESAPYGILQMPRIGSFEFNPSNPKTSIKKAKIDKKNPNHKFVVSIGVDYSRLLLEDSYLTDSDNYEINNKAYTIEISKNANPASPYTHTIKIMLDASQPVISRGIVKISLMKKSAPWADDYTDYDGIDINAEGAMNKTFGLKYLIEGVYDAYKSDNKYAEFSVNIQ